MDEKIISAIIESTQKVIVGKEDAVKSAVLCLLCGGHLLIEDVPGIGKTSLALALARSLDLGCSRIQFTPDIMPSDITGLSVYNPATGSFVYREGPVMTNIVLADEINRTSPKTQSSLLEVMQEGCVTVDGQSYRTPKPFMVIATQNPIEHLGTFPLPEAQLDRFLMKISVGYPNLSQEIGILTRFQDHNPAESLVPVASAYDIIQLQEKVRGVFTSPEILSYIVTITAATRGHRDISLGASPRASLGLMRAAQASALMSARDYVIPDDVRRTAPLVIPHRLILSQEARLAGLKPESALDSIISRIPVPAQRG